MKRILPHEAPTLWDEDGVEPAISSTPIDIAAIATAGAHRTPLPLRRSAAWEDIVGTYGQPPLEAELEKMESTPLDVKARVAAIRDQLK